MPTNDDPPLGPADGLSIINNQLAHTRARSEPSEPVLLTIWGLAWLLGYSCLFSTARHDPNHNPSAWAFTIFGLSLAAAIVLTIVHVVRRTAGIRGLSARSGAMFGWSWTTGFIAIYLIAAGLTRAGAPPQVMSLVWNALPILLVGILYMTGGALWQSIGMYALGVYVALLAGAATLIGLPGTYLLMALAGGGGLLAAALITMRRCRRESSADSNG